MLSVSVAEPEILPSSTSSTPPLRQRYARPVAPAFGVPVAVTVNFTDAPANTVCDTGCWVRVTPTGTLTAADKLV